MRPSSTALRRVAIASSVLLISGLLVQPLLAQKVQPTVSVQFYGHADWELYTTYAWREGVAARDPALERQMRDGVDAVMKKKGWTLVADAPDIWILSESKAFGAALGMGAIQLSVVDAPTDQLAWRALVANMAPETRQSLEKMVDKVIKLAFKDFPRAAARR